MAKREITPHKGGRVIMTTVRMTQETADKLAALNITLGDLVEWAVEEKTKEAANGR